MNRILFAIPQLYGGGAERVTAVVANALSENPENEIHIIVYKKGESDYFTNKNIKIYNIESTLGESGHNAFAKIKEFKRIISEINPLCVVSLAGAGMAFLLALSVFGTKTKLVLSERNDPKRDPKGFLLRTLRTLAYELCSGVVFQTSEAKSFFSKRIQKKSAIITNPLTCESLPEFDGERAKRIVNWCRLNPQKNLDLLPEEFLDYVLEIYGEGSEKERLLQKIKENGFEEKIILHDFSKNIHEEVKNASLFVSSSDYEGISNSMLEAIAMGIPSICTDCPAGGARETIENGVNGILVPVGDKERMKEAMIKVLSDPEFAEKLGKEGSKLKEKISSKAVAKQWLQFIEKITKN